MDRRNFIRGLLGIAGAAAAASVLAPSAEAAPLLDTLKDMDAGKVANPLANEADLPAEGAQESQFYFGGGRRVYRRPVYYRRPIYRRPVYYRPVRRARCVWVRNRFGGLVRRCF